MYLICIPRCFYSALCLYNIQLLQNTIFCHADALFPSIVFFISIYFLLISLLYKQGFAYTALKMK